MARTDSKQEAAESRTWRVFQAAFWLVICGVWLLTVLALASYDPADPPGHAVAPLNEVPRNLVGPVGAQIAHRAYLLIGPGVWIFLTGMGTALGAKLFRQPVTQPVLRLVGLLLMTFSASTMVAARVPVIDFLGHQVAGVRPEGPGGLVGIAAYSELVQRFNPVGTSIVLGIVFMVGSLLAVDQLILALANALGTSILSVTHLRGPLERLGIGFGRCAFVAAGAAGSAWGAIRGSLRRQAPSSEPLRLPPKPRRKRAAEIEDEPSSDEGVTHKDQPKAPAAGEDSTIELAGDEATLPQAAATGEASATDEASDASGEAAAMQDSAEAGEDEAEAGDDAPAAYVAEKREFTPEQLREKISQLPINFANQLKPKAAPQREVDLSGYQFPSLDLLLEPESSFNEEMEKLVREQAAALEAALREYRIEGEVVGIDSGPVITLYEVRLAPGTKVGRLQAVASDLARALKAHNIRIVSNIVGKDTIGVEVPNAKKEKVRLKELMNATADQYPKMALPMFLGKDASGNPLVADLARMPHMLIAGTTGSGKSVCMNSIIMSFLYTRRPDELKLVLVDPKMVEMSQFKDIPHLMCPVVTEMNKAAAILEWATTKMDERYELLAEAGVRDIASYNSLGWEELKERMQPATEAEEAVIPKKLPYFVLVIDELADLMMTNKEVEGFIVRIAQKARAVGIHLILATQRPQANVVTGLIKSNMPCRISFKVASGMDSRIVLDSKGAELLLGQGDMLYLSPGTSKLTRSQGTLVDDAEIRKAVRFLKDIATQNFETSLVQLRSGDVDVDEEAAKDPLFDPAVRIVLESKRGSVSLLQRRLTIGYARASRLIEAMAKGGILGEYKGSQAREVTMTVEEWDAIQEQARRDAAAAGEDAAEDSQDSAEAHGEEQWEDVDDEKH